MADIQDVLNENPFEGLNNSKGGFGIRFWPNLVDYGIKPTDVEGPDVSAEFAQFGLIIKNLKEGKTTWRDVIDLDFENTFSNLPQLKQFFEDTVNTAQYNDFLNEFSDVFSTNDPEKIKGVVDEYEQAGIATNPFVVENSFSFSPPSGDTIFKEMCKSSGSAACAGIRICTPGQTTTDDGQPCVDPTGIQDIWDDLLGNIFVVFKSIGIDIPWLPLPSVFALPTIKEIFDDTFGDIDFDKCDQEDNCVETVTGAIGDAAGRVFDGTKEKVKEVLGSIKDAASNPQQAAKDIYDWIKSVWGEDPMSMPPWIWGVVIAGEYGKDVINEIEKILGKDIDGDDSVGGGTGDNGGDTGGETIFGPNNPNPECVAKGLETGENGECVTPQAQFDCSSVGREQVEGAINADGCDGCLDPENQYINPTTGSCEDIIKEPEATQEQQDCADQGRFYDDIEGCTNDCINPDYEVGADGICGPKTKEPVASCSDPNRQTNEDGSCGESCKAGYSFNNEGICEKSQTKVTNVTALSEMCSNPRPEGFGFNTMYWDRYCGGVDEIVSSNCASQNRQTNEDGSCGDCLPGYVYDENFDQCVQEEVPVTTETPTETTTETTTSSGGDASLGSFGSYAGNILGLSYTPQALPDMVSTPQIDYTSGLLTGSFPSRNNKILEQSIVQGLLGKYIT